MPSTPLTPSQRSSLLAEALLARDGSYSPYSHFRVGACLLAEDGTFVRGANVENASYGGTICAERTAVVKGVSDGKRRFIGLAVASDIRAPISPCGICRQVLREFCPLEMPIFLLPSNYSSSTLSVPLSEATNGKEDQYVETTMEELLPMSFGPEDLDRPRDGGL